jgi:hypothetical protein
MIAAWFQFWGTRVNRRLLCHCLSQQLFPDILLCLWDPHSWRCRVDLLIKWLASWKIMSWNHLQMDRWLMICTNTHIVLCISRHPKQFQIALKTRNQLKGNDHRCCLLVSERDDRSLARSIQANIPHQKPYHAGFTWQPQPQTIPKFCHSRVAPNHLQSPHPAPVVESKPCTLCTWWASTRPPVQLAMRRIHQVRQVIGEPLRHALVARVHRVHHQKWGVKVRSPQTNEMLA